MTPRRKTTQPRARKETVAEDRGGQGKTQGQGKGVQPPPTPDAVPLVVAPPGSSDQAPPPPVAPAAPVDPSTLVDAAPDKGFCDNHPTVPAVLVTNFPWSAVQRFCLPCVPAQYQFLL